MTNPNGQLTTDQVKQIKIILSDIEYDQEELFAHLNMILPKLWLDPKQRNKNVARKHSEQLQELAKTSQSFNLQLKSIDKDLVRSMNSLATKFLIDLIEPNNNKKSLKTISIADVYHELGIVINTVVRSVEHYYLGTKWEKAFSTFHNIWYKTIGTTPSISSSSKFIQCLSVIVDQDSETIYKAAQRSEWFKELKDFQKQKTYLKRQTS